MRRVQNINAQLQAQIDLINSQNLILAEVELDEITAMPDYRQVLRVQDNNIALSIGYLKVLPKRILIHKTTGEEIDLKLPVPDWEKTAADEMALVDENGERILVETNYFDDEDELVETTQEVVLVPTLKYLNLMIKVKKYAEIFQLFTEQYVNDIKALDADYFTRLK